MKIDLLKTRIFCLTCESEEGRKRTHMANINGVEFVVPIMGIAKNKSGASGFMRMVERGLETQKAGTPFRPFMMLEDDVSMSRFIESVDVPDDADILYVGISNCSMNSREFHYANYYETVTDYPNVVRVKHMLSTHGIVVCSPLGAAVIQRTMLEVFLSDMPWDVPLAYIQPHYNVYAMREPLVYQDANYNGDEGCTRITLNGPDRGLPVEWIRRDLTTICTVFDGNSRTTIR